MFFHKPYDRLFLYFVAGIVFCCINFRACLLHAFSLVTFRFHSCENIFQLSWNIKKQGRKQSLSALEVYETT